MALTGPSRTIVVEPIRRPEQAPAPAPVPERQPPPPPVPVPEPERVPA